MPDSTIRLDRVSLRYRLVRQKAGSLKEYAIHLVQGTLRYQHFWALTEVSLSIGRGEAVGIVGRNGAGKSTLLKIIANVLEPTTGTATVRGRVAPVLELGAGFDNDLTGRENAFLYALLLGRSRAEIRRSLDDIIAFSELEDFIDSPLRTYSTGMVARLGFAVATAWMPDILILDEVLAVGDSAFTVKCLERYQAFLAAGTTVLLVSHSPQAVVASCTRCLWIDHGRLAADGPTEEVLGRYLEATSPLSA